MLASYYYELSFSLAAEFVGSDGVQILHETFQIGHLLVELLGAVRTLNDLLRRFDEVIGARSDASAAVGFMERRR